MRDFVIEHYGSNQGIYFLNLISMLNIVGSAVLYISFDVFHNYVHGFLEELIQTVISLYLLMGFQAFFALLPIILVFVVGVGVANYTGRLNNFRRKVLLNSLVIYGLIIFVSSIGISLVYEDQLIDPLPLSWLFSSQYIVLAILMSTLNTYFLKKS